MVTVLPRPTMHEQTSWRAAAKRWPGPILSEPMRSIAVDESEKMVISGRSPLGRR